MSKGLLEIRLVVVDKRTQDRTWYDKMEGAMFFVTECDDKYYNILKPVVGDFNEVQLNNKTRGNGVIPKSSVKVIAQLQVI